MPWDNKKSGRTLQVRCMPSSAARTLPPPRPYRGYIGAEFYDSLKRAPFVIAVRVESEGPMQELHPGDQTWYLSEDGCTLEQLPFIDRVPVPPAPRRTSSPPSADSPTPAAPAKPVTASAGRWASGGVQPLGKKFNEVFQMGTSMDEIPNFREFLYQYILPQPELDLEALQATGWSWKTCTLCWPKPRPAPMHWKRS